MQDFLKMYAGLVEKCFTSCCNDFTSKALSSKEVCGLQLAQRLRSAADLSLLGIVRDELRRKVHKALGTSRSKICRANSRCVLRYSTVFPFLIFRTGRDAITEGIIIGRTVEYRLIVISVGRSLHLLLIVKNLHAEPSHGYL
jgi:hypothetical protein